MTMTTLLLICSVTLSAMCLAGLFWCMVEIKAMQKSTHQVQYVNMGKQEFQAFNDELKKTLTKEYFDNIN